MATLPKPAPRLESDFVIEREQLEGYLRSEGYAESTVFETSRKLSSLIERAEKHRPLPKNLLGPARLIWRWWRSPSGGPGRATWRMSGHQTARLTQCTTWLDHWFQHHKIDPRESELSGPKTRRPAKLKVFDDAGWTRLEAALENERSTEALVLKLAMSTPLRVSQILESPLDSMRRLARYPGAQQDFDALRYRDKRGGEKNETLGQALATTPRGAYVHMHRYLAELRATTGLDFDFNTILRTPRTGKKAAS